MSGKHDCEGFLIHATDGSIWFVPIGPEPFTAAREFEALDDVKSAKYCTVDYFNHDRWREDIRTFLDFGAVRFIGETLV